MSTSCEGFQDFSLISLKSSLCLSCTPVCFTDDENPSDGKILFKKPAKRSSSDKFQGITASSSKRKKNNGEREEGEKKEVKSGKKIKNSSLLSFGGDEEEEDD